MGQNLQDWSYLCLDLYVIGQLAHPRTVQLRTAIPGSMYMHCVTRGVRMANFIWLSSLDQQDIFLSL